MDEVTTLAGRTLFLFCGAVPSGCGAAAGPIDAPAPATATSDAPVSAAAHEEEKARCEGDAPSGDAPDLAEGDVIRPDHRVPAFAVTTSDCSPLASNDLLGERPLVLVFFSSWCAVCDKKMPVVKRAIENLGTEATFLGVALDEDDTWPDVAPFVERYGLDIPLVRGARFRRFTLGYNPFQTIPVVVVVGKDGRLVDLQLGYSPFDYNRLVGAIEVGKK